MRACYQPKNGRYCIYTDMTTNKDYSATLVFEADSFKLLSRGNLIKTGFWYKEFVVTDATTLTIGKICFWFTIKQGIKIIFKLLGEIVVKLFEWLFATILIGMILLFSAPIMVLIMVKTVYEKIRG